MGAGTILDDATRLLAIFDRQGLKQIYIDYCGYDGRWFELHTEKMLLNRALKVKIIPVNHHDLTIEFRLDIEDPDVSVAKDTYARFLLVKQAVTLRDGESKRSGNNT